MHRIRGKLTYSNVMVTVLALVVLGGGTAYAANELEKESVGTKQIAKAAVTPAKLSKAAKKTLTGAPGPTGPVGQQGVPGAKGDKGEKGERGANLTAETPLASGTSESGVYAASGNKAGLYIVGTADFVQPLPAPLDEGHVKYEGPHVTSTECPGPGRAKAGFLCVYAYVEENVTFNSIADTSLGVDGATVNGAAIFYNAEGTTDAYGYGTWTVTAP